jgi:hypothetical protein
MRFKYLPVIFIPAFALLAIFASKGNSPNSFDTNREMVVLRKIGHEILLNAGDKHSRVLPVQKISDQEFRIPFENPVSLLPDSIVNIVNKIAKENKLPEYVINIMNCKKKEVVYGFAISAIGSKQSVIPCLGRALPKDCYYISLMLPDRKKGLPNLYYIGAALAVTALSLFWLRSRSRRKPEPDATPEINTTQKNTAQIGKYAFHPEQQYLELNGEKTMLTNKETRLLYIFSSAPNTVIERSLLQKEVWENEGVIVTRSLDMFISKLRKKLSGDPTIKIVNVHGKGYKLEII